MFAAHHQDDVLYGNHTDNLVLSPLHQEIFAEVFFVDDTQHLFRCVCGMEHDDVAAIGHQVIRSFVREAEHVTQHFCLVFVDDALFRALVEDHLQFVLCHLAFLAAVQSDEFVHQFGGSAQQAYKRIGNLGQHNHEGAEHGGPSFRVVQGDGLGHQFAYDERQIGDDGYYGNHGESLGIGGYSRNEGEQRFYVISDGGTTIGTGYDTDKSNTDLDGGEELFGFFQLFQYSFGSFVPFSDKSFKACFT